MLKRLFDQRRSAVISERGMGAFLPSALQALLKGRCSRCGADISDFTLFGNALVVQPAQVQFLCASCRRVRVPLPQANVLRSGIDRQRVVLSMNHFRQEYNLRDIQLVLALRVHHGPLQSPKRHPQAFFVKLGDSQMDRLYARDWLYQIADYAPPLHTIYGDLLAIGNCGECAAWWPSVKDLKKYRTGTKLFNDQVRWNDNACWACGCPHEMQWHMRATFRDELEMLAKWQSLQSLGAGQE